MLRKLLAGVIVIALGVLLHRGWTELRKPGHFPFQEIHLTGAVQTAAVHVRRVVAVADGTNLLRVDPSTVRKRVLTLPWVRSVRVRRVFPGTLSIDLVEKVAVCMGREPGRGEQPDRVTLLDEYGMEIKRLEVGDPIVSPLVTVKSSAKSALRSRKGRPARIVRLINLLGKHGWLRGRLSEAVEVADDHWTLYTRKGVRLLISRDGDKELELLKRLQERYRILDRKIRQVELRIPGRVAVRAAL